MSSFFPGQDLKKFARIVSHLSSQQSVIFVFRDWKSAFYFIFTSGKFVKKSFKFSASLIICDKTVKNVKKCWISISVLRPGVKSLKYKKIWLGGDPIASTQEYSAINPHFGHFKDQHESMICLNEFDLEFEGSFFIFDQNHYQDLQYQYNFIDLFMSRPMHISQIE